MLGICFVTDLVVEVGEMEVRMDDEQVTVKTDETDGHVRRRHGHEGQALTNLHIELLVCRFKNFKYRNKQMYTHTHTHTRANTKKPQTCTHARMNTKASERQIEREQ